MLGKDDGVPLSAKILIASLLVSALTYVFYKGYTVNNSEVRYTIGEILEKYSDSKGVGKKVIYRVGSEDIRVHCFSPQCKEATVGDRYVLKYYIDNPVFFEILFDHPITGRFEVPMDGWEQVPSDLIH
ncbi:MAG: hypothetical protein RIB86_16750 [Imperialibacter sp.]